MELRNEELIIPTATGISRKEATDLFDEKFHHLTRRLIY